MRWTDGSNDYGWISIALHWLGAGLVLTMLFVGNSIPSSIGNVDGGMLRLHTTIGLCFYFLLWARVIWRVRAGHPGPSPRQKPFSYGLGKALHHLLVAAIAVMLISGPLLAWSGGLPLQLFALAIPSPFPANAAVFVLLRSAHVAAATVLGWGTLVHVCAVIKHTAVDRDGAFDRIMTPEPAGPDAPG